MKKFSKFSKDTELEPHHQIQFNVIHQDNNPLGPLDGNLTGTTTLGHSGIGSNDNEENIKIL